MDSELGLCLTPICTCWCYSYSCNKVPPMCYKPHSSGSLWSIGNGPHRNRKVKSGNKERWRLKASNQKERETVMGSNIFLYTWVEAYRQGKLAKTYTAIYILYRILKCREVVFFLFPSTLCNFAWIKQNYATLLIQKMHIHNALQVFHPSSLKAKLLEFISKMPIRHIY